MHGISPGGAYRNLPEAGLISGRVRLGEAVIVVDRGRICKPGRNLGVRAMIAEPGQEHRPMPVYRWRRSAMVPVGARFELVVDDVEWSLVCAASERVIGVLRQC